MIETVFALLLIIDNEIKEHRIQDSLSKCLKAKRYAMRDKGTEDRVTYQCIKSKANIEIYMGEKKITSLILKLVKSIVKTSLTFWFRLSIQPRNLYIILSSISIFFLLVLFLS